MPKAKATMNSFSLDFDIEGVYFKIVGDSIVFRNTSGDDLYVFPCRYTIVTPVK